MKIDLSPGRYVVAVSGGVDSMVLFDVLRQTPGMELVVAHYDHGIRPDSAEDRKLVEQVAKQYGLRFVYEEGKLGKVSEDGARKARYAFLRATQKATQAAAIITAHHKDDVLETAVLNVLRGTNRRGLTSLQSSGTLLRPLLRVDKAALRAYASQHSLVWHEDSTNADQQYLRNYVRGRIMPALGEEGRRRLSAIIEQLQKTNIALDRELESYLQNCADQSGLNRTQFIVLPHVVAREVMATWLRQHGYLGYDRPTLERLVVAAKTYAPGRVTDVGQGVQLRVGKDFLALTGVDR